MMVFLLIAGHDIWRLEWGLDSICVVYLCVWLLMVSFGFDIIRLFPTVTGRTVTSYCWWVYGGDFLTYRTQLQLFGISHVKSCIRHFLSHYLNFWRIFSASDTFSQFQNRLQLCWNSTTSNFDREHPCYPTFLVTLLLALSILHNYDDSFLVC